MSRPVTMTPYPEGARIVDLTHPLTGTAPAYPGDPAGTFTAATTIADDGYVSTEVRSTDHVGTHADTPAHFLADGETSFDIDVGRWMGTAWITRVKPDAAGQIDADSLTLPPGPADALLISTGHSRTWATPRYYAESPYLTTAAANRIVAAGFGIVGLDFASPDQVGSADEPCHHVLLGASVLIIENLNGVDQLTGDWCWFCAAPLLIGAGDGGFCRAFAAVPSG